MAKSQRNSITVLLGLEGYQVGGVTKESKGVVVEVKTTEEEVNCPYSGGKKLYKHGACLPRRVLHSWSNGKRIYLELYRQRWRCRDCGHSFCDGGKLLRPCSRITKQAEQEALWQLKDRSSSQVTRELGIGYGTLRRHGKGDRRGNTIGPIKEEAEIFLGIDEHSFKHQELVHMVTEVKKRRVLGILRHDQIATLKGFLTRIPQGRVKEVPMKSG